MKLLLSVLLFLFAHATYAAKDDVTIEVPAEFAKSASFKITGELSQKELDSKKLIRIMRYEVNKNNLPVQGSVQKVSGYEGKVNEEIKLYPGHYQVVWNNMFTQFELSANEKLELKLRKLWLGKNSGESKADIFIDFSSKDIHYSATISYWIADHKSFCNIVTSTEAKTNPAIEFCKISESKNLANYLDFLSANLFKSSGKLGNLYANGKIIEEYDYVMQNVSEGDYISVFPGVYGAHITNSDGMKKTRLGIVIK